MADEGTGVRLDADLLFDWCCSLLQAVGVSPDQTRSVSAALVQADLRGTHSHGVEMLPRYIRGFQQSYLNRRAEPTRIGGVGAVARWDGDNGLGHFACERAAGAIAELAVEYGTAAATVMNSNHFGIAGRYAMQLAERGLIGFVTTNTPACMSAVGSASLLVGNNPLAWALPRRDDDPIVLDMSSSAVARGKVRLAAATGEAIPTGWALDRDGNDTTDAHAALEGVLLPVGGAKGFGLAIVNEVLSGVLSGASILTEVSQRTNLVGDLHDTWKIGHFVAAFSPELFWNAERYYDRMDDLVRLVKSHEDVRGEPVLLPGEPEMRASLDAATKGIRLSRPILDRLGELGDEVGIAALEPIVEADRS